LQKSESVNAEILGDQTKNDSLQRRICDLNIVLRFEALNFLSLRALNDKKKRDAQLFSFQHRDNLHRLTLQCYSELQLRLLEDQRKNLNPLYRSGTQTRCCTHAGSDGSRLNLMFKMDWHEKLHKVKKLGTHLIPIYINLNRTEPNENIQ
jgi:hypothetical protein